MKEKNLKIAVRILAILLICLVSFIGVYVQEGNQIINKVTGYKLGMDLQGARVITIKVSDESEEIIKDAEGNVIEEATDEEIEQNGYTKENVPVNKEEDKNVENYKKAKDIIETRLKKLAIQNYTIKLNEENGTITIEVPENENTDYIVSNISEVGKFQITDSEDTENVLLDSNAIKEANVLYNTTTTGTTVYLSMEFNKEGKTKLKELTSGDYETKEEEENDETEDTSDSTEETEEQENNTSETNNTEEQAENTEQDTENQTENTENSTEEQNDNEETDEKSEEDTQKKVTLKLDDTEMITSSFDEPIENGMIQLSMNAATTSEDTLQDTVEHATTMAMLIESGTMPLEYEIDTNEYILSEITQDTLSKLVIIASILVAIALIYLIIKYKGIGLLASISYIGFVGLYMLVIRYTNVEITLEGLSGILIAGILNYILNKKMLQSTKEIQETIQKSTMQAFTSFFVKTIPVWIISIIACFITWMPVSSFGMTLVWGLIIMLIYNIIVTKKLIDTK